MSGLKVYFDLMSQPSRAVLLFLRATKIPHQEKLTDLKKGAHLAEEYKKLNPLQVVPCIDDNGFILSESTAIMQYLCAQYKVDDHWYPTDLHKRAMVDKYLSYQHLATRLNAAMIFRTQALDPMLTGKPFNEKRYNFFKKGLDKTLNQIEEVFLKDQPYLAGDKISIADISGICELMQPAVVDEDVSEGRPVLGAWMQRVKNDLNSDFDDVHKIVYKFRKMWQAKQKSKL